MGCRAAMTGLPPTQLPRYSRRDRQYGRRSARRTDRRKVLDRAVRGVTHIHTALESNRHTLLNDHVFGSGSKNGGRVAGMSIRFCVVVVVVDRSIVGVDRDAVTVVGSSLRRSLDEYS